MLKNTIKLAILVIVLCSGFFFAKVYQPEGKTVRIYKNALRDYNNANYSNSFYLFSKVGYLSPLKPVALYRQGMCARALGDKKAELNSYRKLFKLYPSNKLSMEAKYQAGQLIVEENPKLALRYFNAVSKSNLDSDYKLASEYYRARIEASGLKYSKKKVSKKKSEQIESSFRDYLTQAPDGRLAVGVANQWVKFNPEIAGEDAQLCARAYYLASKYDEAAGLLNKVNDETGWALKASNLFAKHDNEKAVSIVEEGVLKYFDNADFSDSKRAVNDYLQSFEDDNKYTYTSKLFSLAKGKHKDYLWNLKCETTPAAEKTACYNSLYANYPAGEFAQNALLQVFYMAINKKDYGTAKGLAHDFLTRFPDSEHSDEVMFWAGKIEQKYSRYQEALNYFQQVVNKYPDSYYAYRSFWIMKRVGGAVINASLDYKPVVYPYKYPGKGDILYNLLSVDDYDMAVKFSKDDFIKSWVEYKRGNYSKSTIIARDAMAKLKEKPVKSDLRWRLVYPQNYYIQVHKYAQEYKNNDALIMSIIREESHFNSEAQSSVGAIGLMQLMPATAHDIGQKSGLSFNTSYLFNPELNIKLGNMYYSSIRGILNENDIHAAAAYNGGAGAVSKWKSSLKYNDIDEFIEQIPYDETREYVKKVFRSYWNYTRIYQQH